MINEELRKEQDSKRVLLKITPTISILVDEHKATEEYRKKKIKQFETVKNFYKVD